MQQQYHYRKSDGSTYSFVEPTDITSYDDIISNEVPPLTVALILWSQSIPDNKGNTYKVFARHTKAVFRDLMAHYDPKHIADQTRQLVLEYFAGYPLRNPIGLLLYRIRRSPTVIVGQA